MVYVNDKISEMDLDWAISQLPPQRREQTLRFRHELGQRTSAAAWLLLRQALQQEYGISQPPPFGYGAHGKPLLVGHPGIHFNLSHCREAVACVVGTEPVGIDVESIRKYRESLARYTMNDRELQQILSAPRPDVAFIRLWTMKEATLKLTGEGISRDMKDVLRPDLYRYETVERLERGYIYTVCRHRLTNH